MIDGTSFAYLYGMLPRIYCPYLGGSVDEHPELLESRMLVRSKEEFPKEATVRHSIQSPVQVRCATSGPTITDASGVLPKKEGRKVSWRAEKIGVSLIRGPAHTGGNTTRLRNIGLEKFGRINSRL